MHALHPNGPEWIVNKSSLSTHNQTHAHSLSLPCLNTNLSQNHDTVYKREKGEPRVTFIHRTKTKISYMSCVPKHDISSHFQHIPGRG